MDMSTRQGLPTIRVLVLTLALVLNHPLSVVAAADGDLLLLVDQSISMRIHTPMVPIRQWLFDFIKAWPGSGAVVLAGFDEQMHSSIKISREEIESGVGLRAKLTTVTMAGRVTDFEAPLQYLLSSSEPFDQAVIITDGEPEIWDDRYCSLSRRVLNDARYGEINDRYRALAAKGLGRVAIYRQLSARYTEKNIGLIEERLAALKSTLGVRLVFIDLYGKFNFLQRWADLASARVVVAPSPEQAIQGLPASTVVHELKEEAVAETIPLHNQPAADVAPASGQPQPPAGVGRQPVEIVSLPPVTVTLQNAKEFLPGLPPPVYHADPWAIALAAGIPILLMGLLWFAREIVLRQRTTAHMREFELERQELQRLTAEGARLEQEHGLLTRRINETRADLNRLQEERKGVELELQELKRSTEREVDAYRERRFAEVDREASAKAANLEALRQEEKQAIARECDAVKAERFAVIDKELEAERALRAARLAGDYQRDEEAYAQKIQNRKEKALEELTNWKLSETARFEQALASDLERTEADLRAQMQARLQAEEAGLDRELAERKRANEQAAAEYKTQQFAEIDQEARQRMAALEAQRQERSAVIDSELAELAAERRAAIEQEMATEKAARVDAMHAQRAADFQQEEEAYAQKMQARKEKALEELTTWKLDETARQQLELANELAKSEAASLAKIEQWEQEASARVQGLLESRYRELKEGYQQELRLLAEKRETLATDIADLTQQRAQQEEELARRRHEIDQRINDQERGLLAVLKEREDRLWQETVAEATRAKEEAHTRVRLWEHEEKERLLAMIQQAGPTE